MRAGRENGPSELLRESDTPSERLESGVGSQSLEAGVGKFGESRSSLNLPTPASRLCEPTPDSNRSEGVSDSLSNSLGPFSRPARILRTAPAHSGRIVGKNEAANKK